MTKKDLIKWKNSISEMYEEKYYTFFVYDPEGYDESYGSIEFEGLKRSPKDAAEEIVRYYEKIILSAAPYSNIDIDKVYLEIYPNLVTETPIDDVLDGKEYKFEDNLVSFTTSVFYEENGYKNEVSDIIFKKEYMHKGLEGREEFSKEYYLPVIVTQYNEFFEEMRKLGYEFKNCPFSDLVDAVNGVITGKENSGSDCIKVGEIECTIEFGKKATLKM